MSAADLRESVVKAILDTQILTLAQIGSPVGIKEGAAARALAYAALRAVADAGPTDAMVEAGARAIHPGWFSAVWDQIPKDGSTWDEVNREREQLRHDARACFTAMLSAALKEMG